MIPKLANDERDLGDSSGSAQAIILGGLVEVGAGDGSRNAPSIAVREDVVHAITLAELRSKT